jgi:sugar O-acyltransferase (sialic acid O-acetyltransferase NeuD family)
MNTKELLIFGTVSVGHEIYEVVQRHYKNEFHSVHKILFNENFKNENGLKDKLNNSAYELFYIIGFSDIEQRKKCVKELSVFTNLEPATIINPTAYIAESAVIGKGCYIAANASISSDAVIGNHVIINLNASVGHDVQAEDYVIIMPGARISGNVKIGEGSLIGANAFIYQKVNIGRNNLIDALTYIKSDLPQNMLSTSRETKTFKRVL